LIPWSEGIILSKKNRSRDNSSNDIPEIEETNKPARKVVTRSPHRPVGIVACSWIQDHAIEYESQLERRFILQILILPFVRRVLHQPFKLEYQVDGKLHTYIPDFLIQLSDGTKLVIEVKPRKFVKKHLIKLTSAEEILATHDIHFLVITDEEIDDGVKSINVSLILRYARGSISERTLQQCLSVLRNAKTPLSISELKATTNATEGDILYLAGRRIVSLNISTPITDKTTISLSEKDNSNAYLLFCNRFNVTPGSAIARISPEP
jgi:hypothetical protein